MCVSVFPFTPIVYISIQPTATTLTCTVHVFISHTQNYLKLFKLLYRLTIYLFDALLDASLFLTL